MSGISLENLSRGCGIQLVDLELTVWRCVPGFRDIEKIDLVVVARGLLEQVREVRPDYDINEFFSVYCFQKEDDVRRISRAFERADR